MGRLVSVGDTCLNVEERGEGELAVLALHGGPGLDHTMFGWWLDPIADEHRLVLVDERAQGRSLPAPAETWTLQQHARDVEALAAALGLDRYVVLGHSFGAFIALQHAVDFPGRPAGTIVSSGVPSERYLMPHVEAELARFEPEQLREQVTASWEREKGAQTESDCRALLADQLPFHFADPRDPRIEDVRTAMVTAVYSPDVLRSAANEGYGGIEVEDRLKEIRHPVLVLAGRHDRTCSLEAAEAIARGIGRRANLHIFEDAAHLTFVEQAGEYTDTVLEFLARV